MKKKVLIISLTPIVLAVSIFAAVRAVNYYRVKKQTDLKIAYYRQNKYFAALLSRYKYEFEYWHQYLPLDFETNHIDGIRAETYMNIACYRSESGGSMTYAQVIDYLSQEFEDDGKLRIYTNGRHPDIAAYIKWDDRGYSSLYAAYRQMLHEIYIAYAHANEGFPIADIYTIPSAMLDELIKKAAELYYKFDEDALMRYSKKQPILEFEGGQPIDVSDMDLASIQNRYIAEGKAVVSEDGKTIEFRSAVGQVS